MFNKKTSKLNKQMPSVSTKATLIDNDRNNESNDDPPTEEKKLSSLQKKLRKIREIEKKQSSHDLKHDDQANMQSSDNSKMLKMKKKLAKLEELKQVNAKKEKTTMSESNFNDLNHVEETNEARERENDRMMDEFLGNSEKSNTVNVGTFSLNDLKTKTKEKSKSKKKEDKEKEKKEKKAKNRKLIAESKANNIWSGHGIENQGFGSNAIAQSPMLYERTFSPAINSVTPNVDEPVNSSDDEFYNEVPTSNLDADTLSILANAPCVVTAETERQACFDLYNENNEPFKDLQTPTITYIVDHNIHYVNTEHNDTTEDLFAKEKLIADLLNLTRATASFDPTKAFQEDTDQAPLLSIAEEKLFEIFAKKVAQTGENSTMTEFELKVHFKELWMPFINQELIKKGQRFKIENINMKDKTTYQSFVTSIGTSMKQKLSAKKSSKKEKTIKTNIVKQDNNIVQADEMQIDILVRGAKSWRFIHKVGEYLKKISNQENKIRALTQMWRGVMEDAYYDIELAQQVVLRKHIYTELHERAGADYIESLRGETGKSLRKFREKFNDEERIKFCFSHRADIMVINPCDTHPFRLEGFQKDVLTKLRKGKSVLMVAPTSCGKTICAMDCIRDKKSVIMLYPTPELALQAAGTVYARSTNGNETTPIVYIDGTTVYSFPGARVIIGTPMDVDNFFMMNGREDSRLDVVDVVNNFEHLGAKKSPGFDYKNIDIVVVDEYQQVNPNHAPGVKSQSIYIQKIMMCCSRAQLLVLSATISNPIDVVNWMKHIKGLPQDSDHVESVIYTKRFINQERWVYTDQRDESGNVVDTSLTRISCLSVATVESIANDGLRNSEMQFPPNQLSSLGLLIHEKTGVEETNPYKYFANRKVSLLNCKDYEDLLKFQMTKLAREHPDSMQQILDKYMVMPVELQSLGIPDLYKILIDMKEKKMLKVMIFIFDQYMCRNTCYELLAYMIEKETQDYPLWYTLRTEQNRRAKAMMQSLKSSESKTSNDGENGKEASENRSERIRNDALRGFIDWAVNQINGSIHKWESDIDLNRVKIESVKKQLNKIMMMQELTTVNENEPHPDYSFSSNLQRDMMKEINEILNPKKRIGRGKQRRDISTTNPYNPKMDYHDPYMMCAERGMTVYTNHMRELDTRFQGLAQKMLNKYGVQVIFSDASYAFGVNLPVTSVMFYNPKFSEIGFEHLSVILAHQAQGRGARRGLDTKGYVVYVGTDHIGPMMNRYLDIQGDLNNGDGILENNISTPVMFNENFELPKLQNLSIAQWYDVAHHKNVENDSVDDHIAQYLARNKQRLIADIEHSYATITHSPCHMYRMLKITDKTFVLCDFFSYIGTKSQIMTVNFGEYELVRAIASILHPDTTEDTRTVLSYDKFKNGFVEKCNLLNKDHRIGCHVSYASELQANKLLNITDQKIYDLRFIANIMELMYTVVEERFGWRSKMCQAHVHICNLVFKQIIEWGTLEERGTLAVKNSDIP